MRDGERDVLDGRGLFAHHSGRFLGPDALDLLAEALVGEGLSLLGGDVLLDDGLAFVRELDVALGEQDLQRRVDELVVGMEQEAIKLVEVVQGDRDVDLGNASFPAPKETRKEGKKA